MNPTGDTLDIKPIAPTGASFSMPTQEVDEVAIARAKIAAIGQPQANPNEQYILPNQSVSLRPEEAVAAQTIPAPVSPAAEALKHQPKSSKAKSASKAARSVPSPVKPILSALGSFVILLVIFKSQIIFSQLRYLTAKPQAKTATSAVTASAVISADPTITIPKINVSAPVVYQSSIQEAAVLKSLQDGVVHYGTSVVPGQNGNMVIVGHSSNDWWETGNYKFVFVLLDKLVVGDQYSINYQSHKYVYQVTAVKVVEPTDLSVLAPTSTPTATLITCTPPGTSWKRLVVVANQISPTPTATTTPTDNSTVVNQPVQLPGNPPTLTSQINKAWQTIKHGFSSVFGHSSPSLTPAEPAAASPSSSTTSPQTLPNAL